MINDGQYVDLPTWANKLNDIANNLSRGFRRCVCVSLRVGPHETQQTYNWGTWAVKTGAGVCGDLHVTFVINTNDHGCRTVQKELETVVQQLCTERYSVSVINKSKLPSKVLPPV